MKSALLLVSVLGSSVLLAAGPEPPASQMPLLIARTPSGDALWRDARTFDLADGPGAPSQSERDAVGLLVDRQANASGCIAVDASGDSGLGPHKPTFAGDGPKLARLFHAARLVLVGRVTAVSYGFGDGVAGALAEIEPKEVLFSAAPLPSGKRFVILPSGTFTVSGKRICKTSDLYPDAVVGRDLLLFVSDFWGDSDQVFRVSYLQVIPLPEKGSVKLPWTLEAYGEKGPKQEPGPILDYLRGLARQTLAARGPRGAGSS